MKMCRCAQWVRLMKGYPKEKFMRDRIVNALKRFQALWRGYRYKRLIRRHSVWLNPQRQLTSMRGLLCPLPRAGHRHLWNLFLEENGRREGSTTAILFDRGRKSEAIYSCEIVKIAGEANSVRVCMNFHPITNGEKISLESSSIWSVVSI